jgi:hypothetical protein
LSLFELQIVPFIMYCDEFKPLPEFLEGVGWVEKNSKFDIFYQQVKDSPLRKNERIEDESKNCRWIHSRNFNFERRRKFKNNVNVNLLFWGHESRPCLAGGTFGGSEGLFGKPFIDIPYDVWWWSQPTDPKYDWSLSNQGAAIVVHELVNALQCLIRDPAPLGLGYRNFPTYKDAPPGSTGRREHAWVLRQITDEMYEKIQI